MKVMCGGCDQYWLAEMFLSACPGRLAARCKKTSCRRLPPALTSEQDGSRSLRRSASIIAARSWVTFSDDLGLHVFIFRFGTLEHIDVPGEEQTAATGLSERGELIGSALDDRMGRSARPAISGPSRRAIIKAFACPGAERNGRFASTRQSRPTNTTYSQSIRETCKEM